MWRSYDYEFKQENHAVHEKRSSWGTTTYPSHEEYYLPPPTMQKMVNNHPSFHYEPSDDDDGGDHHHDHVAAFNNNRHSIIHHGHYDHENRGNWYRTHHVSNQHNADSKHPNGRILRPPHNLYGYRVGIDQQGKETSRINTNDQNHSMEDYYSTKYFPRKYVPNYGEVSRFEDDYDNHQGLGEELDYNSLMKGMHGGNKVKRIEVIEYERRTYKGARQEWIMLGGNGANYPNKHTPRTKGF